MIGKSWDGSIANGVASTGIDGLKTIVPIAAISSWYDWFFADGAPHDRPRVAVRLVENPNRPRPLRRRAQRSPTAPRAPATTRVWTERDYVADAANVKASVFAIDGQQDLNVSRALRPVVGRAREHGVERKLLALPDRPRRPVRLPARRLGRHPAPLVRPLLLGYDNGIQDEPRPSRARTPTSGPPAGWPPRTTQTVVRRAVTGEQPGLGNSAMRKQAGTATSTDDASRSETDRARRPTPTPGKTGSPPAGDLSLSVAGSSTVTATATRAPRRPI